jgi:hypothetical protein
MDEIKVFFPLQPRIFLGGEAFVLELKFAVAIICPGKKSLNCKSGLGTERMASQFHIQGVQSVLYCSKTD